MHESPIHVTSPASPIIRPTLSATRSVAKSSAPLRRREKLSISNLRLHLPEDLAFLAGEHLAGRLDQLAGVAGIKSSEIVQTS